MKRIITLIVSVMCACTLLHAQSESEARSSANYFGEGSSANQDAALEQAKKEFIVKIKPDMMKDAQFRKADDVTCRKIADQAKAVVVNKGGKLTAIVYVAKNELKRLYAEAVMFDELPDDGLDENGNPRDPSAPAPAATAKPSQMTPQVQQVVVVSDGNTAPQHAVSQPVVSQPAVSQPAVSQPQTYQQPAQVTQPVTASQPAQTVASPALNTPAKTGNKLLDEILDARNLFELNDFFTNGKNTGALAYGRLNTMSAPENSYLLLYQPDGTIVAVYDRGSSTRRNLRTGNTENYANAFNNVKIIWFQLYQ